jgi:hypothetical protein
MTFLTHFDVSVGSFAAVHNSAPYPTMWYGFCGNAV